MAKTSKSKSGQPAPNSRAARRAASPSLEGNIDKSLFSIPRPSDSSRPVLAPNSSGISKKSSRKTRMSRSQRMRHEKGLMRADVVRDQFEVKVSKSSVREKKVKERRKGWEEINERVAIKAGEDPASKKMGRFALLADGGDMEVEAENDAASDQTVNASAPKDESITQPVVQSNEDEDEIL